LTLQPCSTSCLCRSIKGRVRCWPRPPRTYRRLAAWRLGLDRALEPSKAKSRRTRTPPRRCRLERRKECSSRECTFVKHVVIEFDQYLTGKKRSLTKRVVAWARRFHFMLDFVFEQVPRDEWAASLLASMKGESH